MSYFDPDFGWDVINVGSNVVHIEGLCGGRGAAWWGSEQGGCRGTGGHRPRGSGLGPGWEVTIDVKWHHRRGCEPKREKISEGSILI